MPFITDLKLNYIERAMRRLFAAFICLVISSAGFIISGELEENYPRGVHRLYMDVSSVSLSSCAVSFIEISAFVYWYRCSQRKASFDAFYSVSVRHVFPDKTIIGIVAISVTVIYLLIKCFAPSDPAPGERLWKNDDLWCYVCIPRTMCSFTSSMLMACYFNAEIYSFVCFVCSFVVRCRPTFGLFSSDHHLYLYYQVLLSF